jgi:hypothetical protein
LIAFNTKPERVPLKKIKQNSARSEPTEFISTVNLCRCQDGAPGVEQSRHRVHFDGGSFSLSGWLWAYRPRSQNASDRQWKSFSGVKTMEKLTDPSAVPTIGV